MSLATRCPSCGTVFRVVQDQLKVSEGWVRCGRCNEVFSALDGLFDLEREPAPAWNGPADGAPGEPGDHPLAAVLPPTPDAPDPALIERLDAHVFGASPEARTAAPAPLPGIDDESPYRPEPRLDAYASSAFDEAEALPPGAEAAAPAESVEPAAPPEFIRHADRQARWQQPRVRIGLAATAAWLVALLLLQWAVHFRDVTAARWPAAKPLLAGWCALWHCTLEAPRRIEDVSVENTSLTRAAGPDAFRLTVTLRNRGGLTVALPSVDLTLTDSTGQLIARRALAPADFHAASPLLPPGAESPLQLLLTAGTPRVTGYTVEIFYP
jgi:predicted Zn finger-like uncharacterized protein